LSPRAGEKCNKFGEVGYNSAMTFPDFAWAVGEESSDPISIKDSGTVRVDELAQSDHLARQDGDLADVAGLGVRIVRYGMPWRLSEPEPGRYDWTLWDTALAACERHGIEPIVDLCHFGLPDHLPGFADPTWVDAFLRYFEAFLDRYPLVRWFTPVNEPMTVALLSARYGAWNDRLASDEDYANVLALCTVANLEAHARLVADRGGWSIGAEALGVPRAPGGDEAMQLRLALERAPWDLQFGKPLDPLAEPAFAAVPDARRGRIAELATNEHVISGHDCYPISIIDMPDDVESILDAYEAWATDWYARYATPFWVAETSNLGLDVARQSEWLDAYVARLAKMRSDGLPVRGLCWYSRGDQFDWQTALIEPTGALTEVGLFTQDRVARPVAARFAEHVRAT
jgi:beta-glucosidase/6-phospho-beta-glucosidase/beta-galactosidase